MSVDDPNESCYSSALASELIRSSLSEIRRQREWDRWSSKLAADCTRLGEAYYNLADGVYKSALGEAEDAYRQYHLFTHKIVPLAEANAASLIAEAYDIVRYCDVLLAEVWKDVGNCLQVLRRENKLKKYAENEAKRILDSVLRPAADSVKSNESEPPTPASTASYNQNNNCSIDVDMRHDVLDKMVPDTSIETSHSSDETGERLTVYANDFVLDLIAGLKHADLSNVSQKSSSHCGSRESLSSDLMSPRSVAESRGLHQFADKLLYSLSILEDGSNDSISGVGVGCDVREHQICVVEGSRRSSAPELRTSTRKYGLKTVFEENVPIRRSSVHGVRPLRSSWRKLHSSSLECIEDNCLRRLKYSELLTKDILCSAFVDML